MTQRDSKGRFIKGHSGYKYWEGKEKSQEHIDKISNTLTGRKLSMETRIKMQGRIAEKSPSWRGGKTIRQHGYILISCVDHPNCNKNSNYVYEHRLVMEVYLKRYLKPEEIVHHINKNTLDNRIENLLLFKNQSEHIKHHKEVKAGGRL